ncbi:MAG: tetratricopeptide repeat protein, partial [Bacteroidota bacterium]
MSQQDSIMESLLSARSLETVMSNTYNDDAIEDCIWSVIESSQNVADYITYLQHLLTSSRHRDKAIDKAVSLFSPSLSSVQGSYYGAFEAIERITKSDGDEKLIKSAWFNYAKMLHNGYGVAADRRKAARAYERAISLGEVRSLINLGALYERGVGGINQDLPKARDLFQHAIDRQEPLGYLRMAETLAEDAYEERRDLFIKGAEAGCMYAAIRVGKLFNGGKEGFEQDPVQGMYWIERSAAAGNGYAAFYMGWHYENGHSVGKDPQLALKWYETGAVLGDRAS